MKTVIFLALLATVHRSIHNGKEEGKNIDTHYSYVKNNLEWRRRNALVEMAKCIQKWTFMEEALTDVITQIQVINL
ncbi:hypothetical protein G5I_02746 [Acromyrmex echinatior]|uniref:Secreted protein n=1 Tax=Acromyrmex echinatior TaxID=103372 RepID=F4WB22_ACREC|nr:hypothetical protein G5I_02746 [Acromyrmex echinatior]